MVSQTAERGHARGLPAPISPFVGRDRDVEAGITLLTQAEARLLTLTGPGGIGKTRLALQVASGLLDQFEDGVFFVDLAAISDPTLIASAIAQVIDVPETRDEPLEESLKRHMRDRELLLVLDSFEQLLAAGPRVAELLTAGRRLKVLVTSRTRLRLSGEHELPVPPLTLPDPAGPFDVEVLARSEAVALFVQRARAAWRDFELTAANAPLVAEICRRLDGLPLAIELAAARIKLLSPRGLLARLSSPLGLLTGGMRDLPARQQAMRATIDWSYRLLDPGAQALFARLAVFAGGWTLEAAERVASDEIRVESGQASSQLVTRNSLLDDLEALVDQSLVCQKDEARFGMLDTIREYAAERLEASGELEAVRRRHAEHFLALAEEAEPGLQGPKQGAWLERLEREHDNLWAALGWSLERGAEDLGPDLGLRRAGALARFWEVRGHPAEGLRWLERALSRSAETPESTRAGSLSAAGSLAYVRADYALAATLHEASLALRRQLGDRAGIAASLQDLSRVRAFQGDLERAEALTLESLALRRELGDRRGVAMSLNILAVLARNRADHASARALFEESRALFRELGDRWGVSLVLNNLARVERDVGDWERTTALCLESLALFRDLDDRLGVGWVLNNLAIVAQRRGASASAACLFGSAAALCEVVGASTLSLSPAEQVVYEDGVSAARAALGDEAFEAARSAGRAMSVEQAVEFARSGAETPAADTAAPASATPATALSTRRVTGRQPDQLTRREREVATIVARGLTDREVAAELDITEGTVGVHLDRIFGKLNIHSRAQLGVWSVEQRLAARSAAAS
jgi:non-specific serine/threonine protein kinase